MSESNTVIGINFGTAYTSIAYLNKVLYSLWWPFPKAKQNKKTNRLFNM
jgi:molecular chaperone DnaK (HSP70)